MSAWIYYPYKKNSAQLNMAIDHTIAKNFKIDDLPVLRFYGWQPYAITIGFHQKKDSFNLKMIRDHGIDFARRPTGGRAIFHGNELTYAIIVPSSIERNVLYKTSHFAFIDAFKQLGFQLDYQKKTTDFRTAYQNPESISCFANSAQFEVSMNHHKVIGSAQRIYNNSILQHGSIMLSNDYRRLADFTFLKKKPDEEVNFINLDAKNKTLENLVEACKNAFLTHFLIDRYVENTYSPDLQKIVDFVE